MKKFEITADDIESFIMQRISFRPDDVGYVKVFNDSKAGLLCELGSINHILDAKYNKQRENGKYKHQFNAEELNTKRKEKTYAKIEEWYKTSADLLATDGRKTSITKIAADTGLHFLTVRNFLLNQGEKLGLEKRYITKNVIEVLKKIFSD